MTLEQGALLNGRYRIIDILGQGGMGSVYRAMDENLGVEVAVKENLFTTDEYARQFRLEAVILASLRHTNLPRVTDHFVIGDQGQYLVMDYIEGEDLRQRMERLGTIPEEDAILIGASMCDALTHLHSRKPPVLHRDIKPGNVKIAPDGQIYLVDFGLAKLVQGSQATTTGARAMTPGYSPPEQYGTARTDPRSDIYSLGATLYASLTGVIPEDGLARVMDNIELTPIRKRNTKVSRRLSSVIEKAMEAYPDDRYQTAGEFRNALLSASTKTQRLINLEPGIHIEPPPFTEDEDGSGEGKPAKSSDTPTPRSINLATQISRRRRSRSSYAPLIATVFAAAVLFLIFWLQWTFSSEFRTAVAVFLPEDVRATYVPIIQTEAATQPVDASQTPEPSHTPVPPTETATPEPTATPIGGGYGQIAFTSEQTGNPQIYIINSDGTGLRPLTNEPSGACQPDWSPDGMRLVYISPCKGRSDLYPGSSLFIINADGSGKIALPTTIGGGDFDPAWSPDGNRIAFTSMRLAPDRYEIFVINLETQALTQITASFNNQGGKYAFQPAWNPFGNQLTYTYNRLASSQIWLTSDTPITVAGKPNLQLTQSGSALVDYLSTWSPDGQYIIFNQINADGSAIPWIMSIRYADRESKQANRMPIEPPITDADFSPDGFWIAFESKAEASARVDIFIATINDGNRMRLTTDPSAAYDPVWRPNGSAPQTQIAITPAASPSATPSAIPTLQATASVQPSQTRWPTWTPSHTPIFYPPWTETPKP
jgi:serine/threonine protein kinase/Tol biopolymer transport system component